MRACFLLLFFFLPAAGFAEGDALQVAEIKE